MFYIVGRFFVLCILKQKKSKHNELFFLKNIIGHSLLLNSFLSHDRYPPSSFRAILANGNKYRFYKGVSEVYLETLKTNREVKVI